MTPPFARQVLVACPTEEQVIISIMWRNIIYSVHDDPMGCGLCKMQA